MNKWEGHWNKVGLFSNIQKLGIPRERTSGIYIDQQTITYDLNFMISTGKKIKT